MGPLFTLFGTLFRFFCTLFWTYLDLFTLFWDSFYDFFKALVWDTFLGPFLVHFFWTLLNAFSYIFWDTFWDPDVNLQNKGLSISLSLYLLYSVALICVVPPPIDELGKWCQFIRTGVGAADIFLNWWYVEKTCSRLIMSWRMYLNV